MLANWRVRAVPMPYNFAPASRFDAIVHGAERPGYHENEQPARAIPGWIDFMKERGIQQVVCLLSDDQLAYYGNVSLIRAYDAAFPYKTVHVPIPDFSVPLPEQVDRVLRVLNEAFEQHRPIVVRARQGWGERVRCLRRGCAFGVSVEEAVDLVRRSAEEQGAWRNPTESGRRVLALLEAIVPGRGVDPTASK